MFKNFKLSSQRGAMFGLDARIALSIFGTLAVVSGYVGISKFTTAQHAALFKEILAYEDALEQMNTDLGVFYSFAVSPSSNSNNFLAIEDGSLIAAKYRNRWNGPYIDGIRQDHPLYGTFSVGAYRDNGVSACNINNDCYLWIILSDLSANVWSRFNRMIDENAGKDPEVTPQSQGRVRSSGSPGDPRILRYRTSVVRRAG